MKSENHEKRKSFYSKVNVNSEKAMLEPSACEQSHPQMDQVLVQTTAFLFFLVHASHDHLAWNGTAASCKFAKHVLLNCTQKVHWFIRSFFPESPYRPHKISDMKVECQFFAKRRSKIRFVGSKHMETDPKRNRQPPCHLWLKLTFANSAKLRWIFQIAPPWRAWKMFNETYFKYSRATPAALPSFFSCRVATLCQF